MRREQVLPHVMADMAARISKGSDQYGEPLTTFNGRDALQDAYEEALDQCLYLKQAIMERKEVMQTGSVQSNGQYAAATVARESIQETGSTPVEPPAVSESAAGAWPGPDWSQAPDWATHYAVDNSGRNKSEHWFDAEPVSVYAGCWSMGPAGTRYSEAPSFNYPGHWRESLRKRPE